MPCDFSLRLLNVEHDSGVRALLHQLDVAFADDGSPAVEVFLDNRPQRGRIATSCEGPNLGEPIMDIGFGANCGQLFGKTFDRWRRGLSRSQYAGPHWYFETLEISRLTDGGDVSKIGKPRGCEGGEDTRLPSSDGRIDRR